MSKPRKPNKIANGKIKLPVATSEIAPTSQDVGKTLAWGGVIIEHPTFCYKRSKPVIVGNTTRFRGYMEHVSTKWDSYFPDKPWTTLSNRKRAEVFQQEWATNVAHYVRADRFDVVTGLMECMHCALEGQPVGFVMWLTDFDGPVIVHKLEVYRTDTLEEARREVDEFVSDLYDASMRDRA